MHRTRGFLAQMLRPTSSFVYTACSVSALAALPSPPGAPVAWPSLLLFTKRTAVPSPAGNPAAALEMSIYASFSWRIQQAGAFHYPCASVAWRLLSSERLAGKTHCMWTESRSMHYTAQAVTADVRRSRFRRREAFLSCAALTCSFSPTAVRLPPAPSRRRLRTEPPSTQLDRHATTRGARVAHFRRSEAFSSSASLAPTSSSSAVRLLRAARGRLLWTDSRSIDLIRHIAGGRMREAHSRERGAFLSCAASASTSSRPAVQVPHGAAVHVSEEVMPTAGADPIIAERWRPPGAPLLTPAPAVHAGGPAPERTAAKHLLGKCAGPRRSECPDATAVAGATTASMAAAALTKRPKTVLAFLFAALLQQRMAFTSCALLYPCRELPTMTTRLCSPCQQSTWLLSELMRTHLSAWLLAAPCFGNHLEDPMTSKRGQRCSVAGKVSSHTPLLFGLSTIIAPVLKSARRDAPSLAENCLHAVRDGISHKLPGCRTPSLAPVRRASCLSRAAPAAAPIIFGGSTIFGVRTAADVDGTIYDGTRHRWWPGGAERQLHAGVAHPLGVCRHYRTPYGEADSPQGGRQLSGSASGLEVCGDVPAGAGADPSGSLTVASTCGDTAAVAGAGQQSPLQTKNLLSFDACTVRIPHPSKRDKGGEDASTCSTRLLVVADGVGGWGMSGVDAGLYSRELVQRLRDVFEECCEPKPVQQPQQEQGGGNGRAAQDGQAFTEESLAITGHSRILSERTPDPVQLLKAAYLTTRAIGSSTCCLVVLDRLQRRARCANIGDSGFIVYRPSKDAIIARSNFQCHDFNFPLQLGTGSSDMPEHAHVLDLPVQEGDIFLLATDGVWDNLYDEQMLEVFRRDSNVHTAAEELSRLAFKCSQDPSWNSPFSAKEKEALGLPGRHAGGKPDDITVVVAVLKNDRFKDNRSTA